MLCPHCQAQVKDGDAYCISCGARIGAPPGAAPPASGSSSGAGTSSVLGRPRSGLRVALVVVVNLLLLAGSAYLVHALLGRYAAAGRAAEPVRLGEPRRIASAHPTDAGEGRVDLPRSAAAPVPKDARKVRVPRPGTGLAAASGSDASTAAAPGAEAGAPDQGSGAGTGSASGRASGSGAGTGSSAEPDSAEQVRATLDADSVRMVVSHHMPQVRACYDRALKQQETIRGVVEVQFEVTAKGRVSEAKVHRNTTGHAGLGNCIAYAIKGWRFPRPVGGDVTFIYPFVFSSGD